MADDVVVFVSDAHFTGDPGERDRRASFVRFLAAQRGIDRLVVAGDLFQFWFDLGGTMPKGCFDVLAALRELAAAGVRIDYLAGNHDYWRSGFFRDEIGIATHAGPLDLDVQGRRVRVLHGDGAGPGDLGYKLLRAVVRQPLVVGAARLVHPDALSALARAAGRASRAHTDARPPDLARLEAAANAAFDAGRDALVMGHVHVQVHRRLPRGELLVIGDWLDLRSWVRLERGAFAAGRWEA